MQKRELRKFVDQLASMDGSEIGLIVAVATHHRHAWEDEGVQLLDPINYVPKDPTVTVRIVRAIQGYQKSKEMIDAAGLMVWLHTMRVGARIELRQLAREMWRHLERGFPHTNAAAIEILNITGRMPRVGGYETFPSGLTPDPI
ncbi:hypothetical protein [Metapseudomonas otitidis]|uniref:hypothetical protein n=1 Tax=Metapseudomonas otitidis TaxID=319939 RepID=UPI0024472191|nr:hypothetical protein [Pseudomonas otitidis]MDG9785306.1 hypothetical protein [Pseudomonas otitidis]